MSGPRGPAGRRRCGVDAERESEPLGAALAAYKQRSAAFYTELTEGPSDPLAPPYDEDEREQMEAAHRHLGRAMEAEVFGDRPTQGAGSPADHL
jgi:hypothetical protein